MNTRERGLRTHFIQKLVPSVAVRIVLACGILCQDVEGEIACLLELLRQLRYPQVFPWVGAMFALSFLPLFQLPRHCFLVCIVKLCDRSPRVVFCLCPVVQQKNQRNEGYERCEGHTCEFRL